MAQAMHSLGFKRGVGKLWVRGADKQIDVEMEEEEEKEKSLGKFSAGAGRWGSVG